jgi:acyl carrier protein
MTATVSREQIRSAIFAAIDRTRELSFDEAGLVADESVVLIGNDAVLDSMGFVNFVVAVEEELGRVSDERIDVVEALNSASTAAPISTAGELIDFLYSRLS